MVKPTKKQLSKLSEPEYVEAEVDLPLVISYSLIGVSGGYQILTLKSRGYEIQEIESSEVLWLEPALNRLRRLHSKR